MDVKTHIEALLFASHHPLSIKRLVLLTESSPKQVEECVQELKEKYHQDSSGVVLLSLGGRFQLATHPSTSELIRSYLKEEISAELTKPQLETLSIVAYHGPLSKEDLEQIRGVNCSIILRNLLIRGLVETRGANEKGEKLYLMTMDCMRSLGVGSVSDLPEYERLHALNESYTQTDA